MPWMKAFGGLKDLHRENKRVERVIEEEFERVRGRLATDPPTLQLQLVIRVFPLIHQIFLLFL